MLKQSEKKLNIALVIDSFGNVDGVSIVIMQYARILKNTANITIVYPKTKRENRNTVLGTEHITCPSFRIPLLQYDFGLPNKKKLLREFKLRKIDIVHIHSPFALGKICADIAKSLGIPVVATLHSQYHQDFKNALKFDFLADIGVKSISKVFNSCDEVWAVNGGMLRVLDNYGHTGKRQIMRNATEMLPLTYDYRNEISQKYNIKPDVKTLLFVGRLIPLKNVYFIVEVMKELSKRNFKYKMLFVGEGYARKQLEAMIEEYGLNDRITLTGKIVDRDELAKLYQKSDLLIFPSFYDSDGLVKYEAASQGTPTIFAQGALCAGSIKDGELGYLAQPDPKAFADRIVRIFENDQLYQSVCGRVYNELYTTWEQTVNNAFARYSDLVNKSYNA